MDLLPVPWDFSNIRLIGVAGIPGVGKSTVLKRLEERGLLGQEIQKLCEEDHISTPVVVDYVHEPISMWEEKGWFEAYSSDRDQHAFAFQIQVFTTYVDAVLPVVKRYYQKNVLAIIMVERTMYDQLLFWKTQLEMKYACANTMSDDAYMCAWKRWCWFVPPVRLILFMETQDIKETFERVGIRGRDGESKGLSADYQSKLLARHQQWFTSPRANPPHAAKEGIPCAHVDASRPFHQGEEVLCKLAQEWAKHIFEVI